MKKIIWKIKKLENLTAREMFEVARLRMEVFVTEQKITDPELDQTDLTAWHIFGINEQNNTVAVARFFFKNNKLLVGRVAVSKNHRREHLGSMMMTEIEKYVRTEELAPAIYLHAQLYIKNFYENLGYQVAGDIFDEAGIEHVMMKKDI